MLLITILLVSIFLLFTGSTRPLLPAAHAVTGKNLVGVNCALGTIDPTTGTEFSGRDGNGTIENVCQWLGDTDHDGVTPETGAEPLVMDPAPLNPSVPCNAAPCGAPGGG